MAKRKPHLKSKMVAPESKGRKKKAKEPTQRTPMKRVMVLQASGKTVMRWVEWDA
jgi:hypothetical protein